MAAYRLCERLLNGAYSNLADVKCDNERDRAFASALSMKVLEHRLTLEHIARSFIRKPLKALDKEVYTVLLMGLCELLYMDTPDSAAVNENVELIKALKKSSAQGLINAVLRNFIRSGKKIPDAKGSRAKELEIRYSVPEALIDSVISEHGEENAMIWLDNTLDRTVWVRVNPLKAHDSEIAELLNAKSSDIPHGLSCEKPMTESDAFREGKYHVQGLSSQICAELTGAKPGDTVIDTCSAPGGKTFTMCEKMENKGVVYSCDKTEKRTGLVEKGAQRLGLDIIRTKVMDSRICDETLPPADVVLCDVPCSGYGVISSKPEIRYKPLKEFDKLPEIQYNILRSSSRYVRPGGRLIYSTCTIRKAENEDVCRAFLDEHKDFRAAVINDPVLAGYMNGNFMNTIFAPGCDGFFVCVMERT